MRTVVRWSAWWLLAAGALFAFAWLARYDLAATTNGGSPITITLDRWTGTEEECALQRCVVLDRTRLEQEQPTGIAQPSGANSPDFDKAFDQATTELKAEQQHSSPAFQGRLSNGFMGILAGLVVAAIGIFIRPVLRNVRKRSHP